jgi:hypothetical protein
MEAASSTSTQSLCAAGVNCLDPLAGKLPADVAFPVRGSNHHAFTGPAESFAISTVIVLALGMYAITVFPSAVLAAVK